MKHFSFSLENNVPPDFYNFLSPSILFVKIIPIERWKLKLLFRDYVKLHMKILNNPYKWGKGDLGFSLREFI